MKSRRPSLSNCGRPRTPRCGHPAPKAFGLEIFGSRKTECSHSPALRRQDTISSPHCRHRIQIRSDLLVAGYRREQRFGTKRRLTGTYLAMNYGEGASLYHPDFGVCARLSALHVILPAKGLRRVISRKCVPAARTWPSHRSQHTRCVRRKRG